MIYIIEDLAAIGDVENIKKGIEPMEKSEEEKEKSKRRRKILWKN